ncbi:MAG: EAL domain-containing protein [Acidimicrobiales bacterium]
MEFLDATARPTGRLLADETLVVDVDADGRVLGAVRAQPGASFIAWNFDVSGSLGDYRILCHRLLGADRPTAERIVAGIRGVLVGRIPVYETSFTTSVGGASRCFLVHVAQGSGGAAVVAHSDISTIRRSEAVLGGGSASAQAEVLLLLDAEGELLEDRGSLPSGPIADLDHLRSVLHPSDLPRCGEAFLRCVSVPEGEERILVRLRRTDGGWAHLSILMTNQLHAPEAAVVFSGHDVSAVVHARLAEHLRDDVLADLPAAVIGTDDAGVVVVWNHGASALFGRSSAEMQGRTLESLAVVNGPWSDPEVVGAVKGCGKWSGTFPIQFEGSIGAFPMWISIRRTTDPVTGLASCVLIAVDESEKERLRSTLAHRDDHDPLTNLLNREGLLSELGRAMANAEPESLVAVVSLDRFYEVNATVGAAAGDRVLRRVGRTLEGATSPDAAVGRLYSDVFAIVTSDASDPLGFGRDVLASLEAVEIAPGTTLAASIGVRVIENADTDPTVVLDEAREVATAVRAAGGNNVSIFETSLRSSMLSRIELQHDLQRALDRRELRVKYQPVIRLGDGAVVGVEALIRWPHPTRGMVGPDEFIPIAEETGAIHQLGAYVLDEACAEAARWSRLRSGTEPPFRVAVNLSAAQLADERFAARVDMTIERHDLDPSSLTFELTESVLMSRSDAVQRLTELKAVGVRIAIDDFGTGYSSLSRLKDMPIDVLKIDRSFVADICCCGTESAIISTILQLAYALDLDVVAEGVETEEHRDVLHELRCPNGQGFLWSPAVDPSDIDRLLAERFPPATAVGECERVAT